MTQISSNLYHEWPVRKVDTAGIHPGAEGAQTALMSVGVTRTHVPLVRRETKALSCSNLLASLR